MMAFASSPFVPSRRTTAEPSDRLLLRLQPRASAMTSTAHDAAEMFTQDKTLTAVGGDDLNASVTFTLGRTATTSRKVRGSARRA